MTYQRSRQSNGDNATATAIDAIIEALRQEWRVGFSLANARRVSGKLRALTAATESNDLGLKLANAETLLSTYLTAGIEERPATLQRTAAALKQAREVAQTSPPLPARKPVPATAAARPGGARPLDPSTPVRSLPRVGEAVARKLATLGVATVGDAVRMMPRRHIDYSQTIKIAAILAITPGQEITIRGHVAEISSYPGPPARVQIRLKDETGFARVTWFNPWIARQLVEGDEIAISGKPERGFGSLSFTSPDWERMGGDNLTTGRLTPVYAATQGLAQKSLRSITRAALDATAATLPDYLPETIRDHHRLLPLNRALEQIHYPVSLVSLDEAKRRLAFDEMLLLQLGLVTLKRSRQSAGGMPLQVDDALIARFVDAMPFKLTSAQDLAVTEVLADLQRATPMTRLLQGDVGSGKTVVAAIAALAAVANGAQAAVMAPTEILAEQHVRSFTTMFEVLPIDERPVVALLTGSTPTKTRRQILANVETGEIDILVGTHTLIQPTTIFYNLALTVVDEQHRFGVRQRAELMTKSTAASPHMLAMTATPIPRTLNMVLNGDLDVTIIGERPPGRIKIETRRFTGEERERAYDLLRHEVALGRQVFVICPLVEESETSDARAAVAEAERLQHDVFPDLRVSMLHGRMSGKEKDRIMTAFRDRQADILVSTSVIEVGVDVPNATVMMIEGAERFGLAQLHQFRGRVGRSDQRSFCLLLAEEPSLEADSRLEMMIQSDDGFELADRDLELRGPGDFVGTRQSGLPEMQMFAAGFDSRLLDAARRSAESILDVDPSMTRPENAMLLDRLRQFWHATAPDLPFSGQYHQS